MLIDREALSNWCNETMSAQTTVAGMAYIREFWNKVLDAPVVEAVKVVRCKDCQYGDINRRDRSEKRYISEVLMCRNTDLCGDEPLAMLPDDYCSYGRRESEGT